MPLGDLEGKLSLSPEDWRLHFLAAAETLMTKHSRHLATQIEKSRQSRAEQNRASCLAWEGPHHRVSLPGGPPHNCAGPQPYFFIIELFVLNKISSFTAPRNEYSYCCSVGVNDNPLTRINLEFMNVCTCTYLLMGWIAAETVCREDHRVASRKHKDSSNSATEF